MVYYNFNIDRTRKKETPINKYKNQLVSLFLSGRMFSLSCEYQGHPASIMHGPSWAKVHIFTLILPK